MGRDFDLFGNPLPRNLGKPGRNEHVPTPEIANRIRALLVSKWTLGEIAKEIGVSAPTIRKHYFRSVREGREVAVREVLAKATLSLMDAAEAGNVGAMKELRRIALEASVDRLPSKPEKPKSQPLGKKAQQHAAARRPVGGWAGRLGDETSGPH